MKLQPAKKILAAGMTVIGTGAHKYSDNEDKILSLYKKDLSEVIAPIQYTRPSINIQIVTPGAALVSGRLSIKGESNGISFSIPDLRCSAAIKNEKSKWLFLHLHISVPNGQQEDEELYPLQKIMCQNEMLNKMVEERTLELQEINKELQLSNSTKDKLLSVNSHDLRSPLNSILGYIKILRDRYDHFDSDSHKEFIGIIVKVLIRFFICSTIC